MAEIASMSAEQLGSLFDRDAPLDPPEGVYRGRVLRWFGHPTARRPRWRWSQRVAFEWVPFGIDFDRRLWFFFASRLAVGRFEARPSRSRWRDTRSIGLHYETSRLPGLVRGVLYDEVKPLSERWVLGIGGINADRGEGDHFWFVLERVP